MKIDTEFNVGDNVCYLSGDNICYSTVSKITIEISYTDRSFLMVYKLSDGLSVPRNNGYWKCRHLIEFWRNKYEKTCKSHYSGICGSRLSDLW